MDKDVAVLQGGFLLANKLCSPTSLSSLPKGDWSKVRKPILDAIREVCGQELPLDQPKTSGIPWKKKLVCALWLRLKCKEAGQDMETTWRNPLFSFQSGFPDLNYSVLLELVKSLGAAEIFAQCLLCLPGAQISTEIERLTHHVRSSPTSQEDVQLFLDVWWELWKGKDEQVADGEDHKETMFTTQIVHLFPQLTGLPFPVAKRRKLDTSDVSPSVSSATHDVLHVLLNSLKDMRDHTSTTDLCLQALSISLDSLYTSFLIDQAVPLTIKRQMDILSKVVAFRKNNGENLTSEFIREAQRDLRASHSPSQFQPSEMNLNQALEAIMELAHYWSDCGLLKLCDGSNSSYAAFKLQQSVQRVLEALEAVTTEMDGLKTPNILREVVESLGFSAPESSPEVNAKVIMLIINHHLEAYQDFAVFFASEMSWASCDENWIKCLEKNHAAFQQPDVLIKLASTLISQFHLGNVSQCQRMRKIILAIFSKLSLDDKNRALVGMLGLSPRGFFGCSVPASISEDFQQELNLVFNSIIQPEGGASAARTASLVAQVAFQNPETTLKSCCHSAVFNKGAFSFMANILQQLPGLKGTVRPSEAQSTVEENGVKKAQGNADGKGDCPTKSSLLCKCLQELVRTKVLSNADKEQFLQFVSLLMKPITVNEGDVRRQSFLSPQEVVNIFVMPNLFNNSHHSIDTDLSLQLLHGALSVDLQEPSAAPWVLSCSPFPLLYILAQLLHQSLRCWEQPPEGSVHQWSMDTKELLVSVLSGLSEVLGSEVASNPHRWSRALFWLHSQMEKLDWSVRFYLKPVWGDHFKNEVPLSLLTVCDLPEQEWSGLDLPEYGQGTGLLAWMECCSISDSLQSTMLSHLALNGQQPDHMIMFSKGLLVALTQTLPWCTMSQWSRLLGTLTELLRADQLHVPYSLEYVDYLPLLDLRGFSCELQLSVLLLRALQLLCGCSCSDWLSVHGWAHVGRLYAQAVRMMLDTLRAKLPLPSSGTFTVSPKHSHLPSPKPYRVLQGASTQPSPSKSSTASAEAPNKEVQTVPSQEVLFVLSQLFCHIQHVQVMMPGGPCEPLFLTSLEILSHSEAMMAAFPESSTPLESDITRRFLSSITDNLQNNEMKAVLHQKITQLRSTAL